MRCIIVEDEPAAQAVLEHNITLCPGLECCGIFSDAFSAQEYLDQHKVDLMFLDINLPGMSGVSFLRSLVSPPMVIFTTAYPQYAIEGYDLEIIDFLLKPFSLERFIKAVNKAKQRLNAPEAAGEPAVLNVRSDRMIYRIVVENILYIEACGDYVSLFCTDKKLVVHGTLKSWEEKLSHFPFQKIHRTILVNIKRISHMEGNLVHIGVHKLPVSETYRQLLVDQLFR